MVDIPLFPVLAIHPFENDRGITSVKIVILKIDTYLSVP
jgi:hypothetical protein